VFYPMFLNHEFPKESEMSQTSRYPASRLHPNYAGRNLAKPAKPMRKHTGELVWTITGNRASCDGFTISPHGIGASIAFRLYCHNIIDPETGDKKFADYVSMAAAMLAAEEMGVGE
jgi:hypothetical protein